MRTSRFPLADRLLDGQLAELLTEWRQAGDSFGEIAYRLRSEYDLPISKETVRRWCIEVGTDEKPTDPKAAAS